MDRPSGLSIVIVEVNSGQYQCVVNIFNVEIGCHHGLQ